MGAWQAAPSRGGSMAVLWRFALGAVGALTAVAGPQTVFAQDQTSEAPASDDIIAMVAAIAEPTASAKLGGNSQAFEKVVTIGRNGGGDPVVTSMQALAPEVSPRAPEGTLALMIVHHEGQCPTPYGNDGDGLERGMRPFVVSASGKYIWEVAVQDGTPSMRLLTSGSLAAWEKIEPTPANYRIYPCKQYR